MGSRVFLVECDYYKQCCINELKSILHNQECKGCETCEIRKRNLHREYVSSGIYGRKNFNYKLRERVDK